MVFSNLRGDGDGDAVAGEDGGAVCACPCNDRIPLQHTIVFVHSTTLWVWLYRRQTRQRHRSARNTSNASNMSDANAHVIEGRSAQRD